jgi:phage terminase large subunit GpA-like protein
MGEFLIFFDECDAYPGDCDGEGSPINLAKARARTFSKKKFFLVSTPTISGMSAIENAFEDSNKFFYHVPCPHCDFYQKLVFSQLVYDKEDAKTTRYQCIECKEPILNWQKTTMLNAGKWVCENEDKDNRSMGYHLSSLYSPVGWYSWNDIIKDWIEAQKTPEALRTFVNTVLGETWKEKTDVPDWSRLYERRSFYPRNRIPKRVVFLTCGVDVQGDRIEFEIVGWCRNKVSYSIDYRIIFGKTDDLNDELWFRLDRLLNETWEMERKTGRTMAIKRLAIDSGYNTQTVYSWVRKQDPNRVVAVKGRDTLTQIVGMPKTTDVSTRGKNIRRGVRLWPVGSSLAKTELYGWLRQPQGASEEAEPYGFCYFPEYDTEFFKMLTGEEYITKIVKGYKKGEWQKTRERNEALDCRVYARAAASIEGIDRFNEESWKRLETEVFQPTIDTPSQTAEKKPKKKREGWL